jgi:DNA-binding transcriptional ArsR family regulator
MPGPAAAARADGGHAGRTPSRRPATLQEARALAHPLRVRILRLCLDRARTNSELAGALGERPATVLFHVRTLLRTGFLVEEPQRPGPRGTVEKPYRATGKSARLDDTMSGEDTAVLRAIVEAVAAEVDEAGPGALLDGVRMPLWLTEDQLADLLAQFRAILAKFPTADEYLTAEAAPGTDPYALLLVVHKRAPDLRQG